MFFFQTDCSQFDCVSVPPTHAKLSRDWLSKSVVAGKSYNITCQVSGSYPAPHISVFLDGSTLRTVTVRFNVFSSFGFILSRFDCLQRYGARQLKLRKSKYNVKVPMKCTNFFKPSAQDNCFTLDSLFKGHGNSGQVILNLIFAGSLTGIFVFKY